MTNPAPLMRSRQSHADSRVSFAELFFDLVFVFAVTQLSHGLLAHFSVLGAAQTFVLALAVWMQWVYTTWVTNWLNPERTAVRLMLLALMLLGLLLSSSLPDAFGERGLVFAVTMSVMHLGRTLFTLWAVRGTHQQLNFVRILVWAVPPVLLWLWGGLSEGPARLNLWALGTSLTFLPALFGYYVPGLGRTASHEWDVSGEHMAERAGLFIIIALGESLLVSGATFAESAWNLVAVLSFLIAFTGTVAMWWTYFIANAEAGAQVISHTGNPGRLARNVYTIIHFFIVLGIVLTAVGDEFILLHPHDPASVKRILLSVAGGPALFLLGNLLFKTVMVALPRSHVVGLLLLLGLALLAGRLDTLMLAAAVTLVQVGVAVWESAQMTPRRAAGNAAADPPADAKDQTTDPTEENL